MISKMGFADAMRADMSHKEMTEAAVGKALGGISQQAVHKWLERGFPPLSRLDDLRDLMGASGEFAKLDQEDLYGQSRASRTPNPHTGERTGTRAATLASLFALLPENPELRAQVFGECARVISAALARNAFIV